MNYFDLIVEAAAKNDWNSVIKIANEARTNEIQKEPYFGFALNAFNVVVSPPYVGQNLRWFAKTLREDFNYKTISYTSITDLKKNIKNGEISLKNLETNVPFIIFTNKPTAIDKLNDALLPNIKFTTDYDVTYLKQDKNVMNISQELIKAIIRDRNINLILDI